MAAAVALQLGRPFTRTRVTRIETGKREVSDYEVVALARATGVDVAWLLLG